MSDNGWILFFFLLPFLAGGVFVFIAVMRDAVLSLSAYDDHMKDQMSARRRPRLAWTATR